MIPIDCKITNFSLYLFGCFFVGLNRISNFIIWIFFKLMNELTNYSSRTSLVNIDAKMDKLLCIWLQLWILAKKESPLSLKVMNRSSKIIVFSFYQLSRAKWIVFRFTNIFKNNEYELLALYSLIFSPLHNIINGEQNEKHLYNQSRHYGNTKCLIVEARILVIDFKSECVAGSQCITTLCFTPGLGHFRQHSKQRIM